MQTFNGAECVYAGFWARSAAFAIDCVIVWFLRLGVRLGLFLTFGILWEKNPLDCTLLFQYTWRDGLLYAAGVLYFVLCTYYAGATLGKKAMNLRLVSADGEPLTFINVLFRETAGRFLSAFVVGLGYLLVGITREKTGLHDMLCDTRVVYAKKIPTYFNGDINKRYVHYEHPVQNENRKASNSFGISVQDDTNRTAETYDTVDQPEGSGTENGKRVFTPSKSRIPEAEDLTRSEISQTRVFRMPPACEIGTPDQNIRVYQRDAHTDSNRGSEKEN